MTKVRSATIADRSLKPGETLTVGFELATGSSPAREVDFNFSAAAGYNTRVARSTNPAGGNAYLDVTADWPNGTYDLVGITVIDNYGRTLTYDKDGLLAYGAPVQGNPAPGPVPDATALSFTVTGALGTVTLPALTAISRTSEPRLTAGEMAQYQLTATRGSSPLISGDLWLRTPSTFMIATPFTWDGSGVVSVATTAEWQNGVYSIAALRVVDANSGDVWSPATAVDFTLEGGVASVIFPVLDALTVTGSKTLRPGNSRTVNFAATRGTSAIGSITFSFKDPGDQLLKFSASDLATGSLALTAGDDWLDGNYRLESVDVVDALGRSTLYRRDRSVVTLVGNQSSHDFDFAAFDFSVTGAAPAAPYLLDQPSSTTVEAGRDLHLTIDVVTGATTPPQFQWYVGKKGDTSQPVGSNSSTLYVEPLASTTSYWVRVSSAGGVIDSETATLSMTYPAQTPTILNQPQPVSVRIGSFASLQVYAIGPAPITYQWFKNNIAIPEATSRRLDLNHIALSDTGDYHVVVANSHGTAQSSAVPVVVIARPEIQVQPVSQTVRHGDSVQLTVSATGGDLKYDWFHNGSPTGKTGTTLAITSVQPARTGIYTAAATNGATTTTSDPAILGVLGTSTGNGETAVTGVIGDGSVVLVNHEHPNGKFYDQVLLTGAAGAVTPAAGRVTRTSFIDLDDDIVQVEFAGAGTLSLVLDYSSSPAKPVNYTQNVDYMKGHVGVVIAGADETTNVSVFSVGRATAYDPTPGGYDILQSPTPPGEGGTNDPAINGSSLFVGHSATTYDGVADIAFIAISSTNGRFGGVRTANVNFFAHKGLTGLYAPGVKFEGPVNIGDIGAYEDATPVLIIGSTTNVTQITGGDLSQDNRKAVRVNGLTQLKFVAGQDSHGRPLPAQTNRAALQKDGVDVTGQIVVNP